MLDWAIKSLNFQLDDKGDGEADAEASQSRPTTRNALIYASYINIVLANFDILHEPWKTININPKLAGLLENSPGPGTHALLNLLGRLCRAVIHEQHAIDSHGDPEQEEKASQEDRTRKQEELSAKLAHYQELMKATYKRAFVAADGSQQRPSGTSSELQI